MRSTWLSLVFLLLLSLSVDSFSRGAPESACEEDMRPRHGFATQGGRPPAEIVVDQSEVRQDHYLRVTLRSTKPFKGFLLRAEDAQEKRNEFGSWSAVGTWYIPYQNISETSPTSAKYLHCGGAPQSAVTHAGANSGAFVVSFQWRPPADLVGRVRIQATVVEDYRTYWTGVLAPAVTVVAKQEDPVQQIQFVNSDALFGIGQNTRKTTTTTTATRAKIIKQDKSTQKPTKKTTKQISTSTVRSSTQPTTESTIAKTTTKRTTKVTMEKVTELPASSTIISSSVSSSPITVTESSTVTTTARTTSQKIQLTTKEQLNISDATVSLDATTDQYDVLSESTNLVTDLPIEFKHVNGTNLFGNDDGRNESLYQPPRSGRRNDEEDAYKNLQAEYGSWKSVAPRQPHTFTLLSSIASLILLFAT